MIGGSIAVSIAIATVLSLVTSRAIALPIQSLTQVAQQSLQELNFNLQASITNNDEIGTLTISFNQLIAIDLEFLIEDLPKLLDSMQGATDRIKSMSKSLRTFSRADTDRKVKANLHEGLDSTLLILKYRLKASEKRPAINIIKDYGDFPEIECFPGQLNQVFMNILANAIDVFDEMAQTQSFEELKANSPTITIRTAIVSNQVQIQIRDNGKGMTEDVQAHIFDHLFTTKAVGKGIGLGLAIARQIVVEKHRGSIVVDSTLGEGTEFTIQLPVKG